MSCCLLEYHIRVWFLSRQNDEEKANKFVCLVDAALTTNMNSKKHNIVVLPADDKNKKKQLTIVPFDRTSVYVFEINGSVPLHDISHVEELIITADFLARLVADRTCCNDRRRQCIRLKSTSNGRVRHAVLRLEPNERAIMYIIRTHR